MPVQPLPSPQLRCRYLFAQCGEWLRAPERTPEEEDAFWRATEHLQQGTWGTTGLAASFLFPGYFHARTATGHYIVVRFGMLPPLPAVFMVHVGSGDELQGWTPPPEPEPHWRSRPAPPLN